MHPIYKFAVNAAKKRFPYDMVTGEIIQGGQGYGIFVERKGIRVCLQTRSKITVDGKEVTQDILNHGSKVYEALNAGFDSMEKGLIEAIHRAESKKRKGLFTRLKEAVFG